MSRMTNDVMLVRALGGPGALYFFNAIFMYALGLGYMLSTVNPSDLIMETVATVPRKVLIVRIDWDKFVALLASSPATSEYRAWLHSGDIQFEQEPFWLKLMLKLF